MTTPIAATAVFTGTACVEAFDRVCLHMGEFGKGDRSSIIRGNVQVVLSEPRTACLLVEQATVSIPYVRSARSVPRCRLWFEIPVPLFVLLLVKPFLSVLPLVLPSSAAAAVAVDDSGDVLKPQCSLSRLHKITLFQDLTNSSYTLHEIAAMYVCTTAVCEGRRWDYHRHLQLCRYNRSTYS